MQNICFTCFDVFLVFLTVMLDRSDASVADRCVRAGPHIMLSPISATYMVTGPTLFSSANEENVFGSAGAHKWEGPMSHEMTAGDAKVQQ